jgi:DNA-binding LytR/AlgR family response regulator
MKIAIVEDDQEDSELLEKLLKQYLLGENMKVDITVYRSGEDLLVETPLELDLLFLDIQMDGLNGIQVAAKVRQTNEHIVIIFVTNNPQYALAGYSVDALDYLIKPPTKELIERLMPRAVRRLGEADRACLTIHNYDGLFVVNLSDINYIELENRRTIVHTKTASISCIGTLQSMEEQLPGMFFRCHSAFLVNLMAVECLKGQDVVVAGKQIPISKHRRREFIRALTECIGDAL